MGSVVNNSKPNTQGTHLYIKKVVRLIDQFE